MLPQFGATINFAADSKCKMIKLQQLRSLLQRNLTH